MLRIPVELNTDSGWAWTRRWFRSVTTRLLPPGPRA